MCLCTLISCSESPLGANEPPKQNTEPLPTQYEVYCNIGLNKYIEAGYNTNLDIVFVEYNEENWGVDSYTWKNAKDGDTNTINAHKLAKKVVVRIKLTTFLNGNTHELNLYVAQVFHLIPESKISITIDGNSRVSDINPIVLNL